LLMGGEDRVKTRFWRFSLRLMSTYCMVGPTLEGLFS
jgi:hypothetical protein